MIRVFQRLCYNVSVRITTGTGISTTSCEQRIDIRKNAFLKISSFLFFCVWSWTLIDVADMVDWTLENVPVFLLIGYLMLTYKRFPFSDLSYLLIFIYLSMHVYGAKHTYAQNPFGFWLQDLLSMDRNHYDRIVHFSFGLLLSYPMREVCLKYYKFTSKIAVSIPILCSLALGAFYEIIEGTVVGIFFPEQGVNFLGIQGDIWDPQKDMFLGFLGSLCFGSILYMIKKGKSRDTSNSTN